MNSKELARSIFHESGVQFGAFKLRLHQENPAAPLSPIYLNLRMPPKGSLTPATVKGMGWAIYVTAGIKGVNYNAVCGVPEAGNPIASALVEYTHLPQLQLDKEESAEGRHIVRRLLAEGMAEARVKPGDRVIVIDDLITKAHSKIEAIKALRSGGLVVEDVAVIVDREQGGLEELILVGVRLHAVWRLTELLNIYRSEKLLDEGKYKETLEYLRTNR